MLREATDPPAAVNVLDVSSESMAAFQVFLYGRFWVFTEGYTPLPSASVQAASERWRLVARIRATQNLEFWAGALLGTMTLHGVRVSFVRYRLDVVNLKALYV